MLRVEVANRWEAFFLPLESRLQRDFSSHNWRRMSWGELASNRFGVRFRCLVSSRINLQDGKYKYCPSEDVRGNSAGILPEVDFFTLINAAFIVLY